MNAQYLPLILTFLSTFVTLFVPSAQALSVDWTADAHPTHTLDHVTAKLTGGSGDPATVNVVLLIQSETTGDERAIKIADNVANTGRYTVQVPNQYVGDPSAGEAMKDYFTRDLRYRTQALNPSNGQVLGQSDQFVVFWNPSDGTPVPTKMSDDKPAPPSSSSNNNGPSGSKANSGSNADNDSTPSSSSSSSGSTAIQPNNAQNSQSSTATVVTLGEEPSNSAASTAQAVTLSGGAISGSTATVTSIINDVSSDAKSDRNMTGPIVGAILGGLVLAALLGFLAIWCYRRRQLRKRSPMGSAFTWRQPLPAAELTTPVTWNDERQAISAVQTQAHLPTSGGVGDAYGDMEETLPRLITSLPTPHRLSEATLTANGPVSEKATDYSMADTNSSYSPGGETALHSTFYAPSRMTSTTVDQGPLLGPSRASSTMMTNSTHASWLTVSQGTLDLPNTPPPQYSPHNPMRRSVGTIDGIMANIA